MIDSAEAEVTFELTSTDTFDSGVFSSVDASNSKNEGSRRTSGLCSGAGAAAGGGELVSAAKNPTPMLLKTSGEPAAFGTSALWDLGRSSADLSEPGLAARGGGGDFRVLLPFFSRAFVLTEDSLTSDLTAWF